MIPHAVLLILWKDFRIGGRDWDVISPTQWQKGDMGETAILYINKVVSRQFQYDYDDMQKRNEKQLQHIKKPKPFIVQ